VTPAAGGTARAERGTTPRAGLKAATASLHAGLEDRIRAARCLDDLDRYRALLAGFHACHAALEPALARLDWTGTLPDVGDRLVKTGWLARDLERLGVPLPAAPAPAALPCPRSTADGLGCLYVLEGATLGGAVVGREVAERLGLSPARGARFFHGYGERRGALWRRFLAALDAHAADPDVRAQAARAARETFAAFDAALPVALTAAA
jgi:heme oxygenase (biliverdin-IX-beta and delta-forming)